MIIELNEENFDEEIKQGLRLVEFYAPWCMYCKKQRIELQDFENSKIRIGIVDGDESPELVQKYGITGYPTFILFKNGEQIVQFEGFHTKPKLLNRIVPHLSA